MPVYPCRHPTCGAYVQRRGDYCEAHQEQAKASRAEQHRHYDKYQRDPESKAFYNSAAWERARAICLREHPVCQRCERAWSRHVHHRKPLKQCTPEEKLDQKNLEALCVPCHNTAESETKE